MTDLPFLVCLEEEIVGTVPANLAPIFSPFLIRDFNTITAIITGVRVNHIAGLGIEVPCRYKLHGPKCYVDRAKEPSATVADCK